jgi:hypothetical protein
VQQPLLMPDGWRSTGEGGSGVSELADVPLHTCISTPMCCSHQKHCVCVKHQHAKLVVHLLRVPFVVSPSGNMLPHSLYMLAGLLTCRIIPARMRWCS